MYSSDAKIKVRRRLIKTNHEFIMVYHVLPCDVIMVYHDLPCFTMMLSWFTMVYHVLPCLTMMLSWFTMFYHGLSWFNMFYHDFIMVYHGCQMVTLTTLLLITILTIFNGNHSTLTIPTITSAR